MRKLLLNKETIARLGQDDFNKVRGGTLYISAVLGVDCYGPTGDCTQNNKHTCEDPCIGDPPGLCISNGDTSCK